MGEGGKIWDGIYMRRFGMGFIYGGSNFVSVQPGWSYLEKREAEWSYLPCCFAGCALVFLHLTLPRGHTDRFSGDYGARPGNFHWRTGWNRWKSTMLSNNWRIIKEWILLTSFIILYTVLKISTISWSGTYWIVFCKIIHTHISVPSNLPGFSK